MTSETETSVSTLFGLPLVISSPFASRLRTYLEDAWRQSVGGPLGPLSKDLLLLERFFDPLKTGRSLRQVLRSLPHGAAEAPRDIPRGLVIEFRDGRRLITPEGRATLACLVESRPHGKELVIRPELVAGAEHQLLEVYRDWAQRRLRSVVRLENAEGHLLHPLGLALLLFLLINRSTDRANSVDLPPEDERGRRLDAAIGKILEAFANVIRPSVRGRKATLRSGYPITEARRLSKLLPAEGEQLYISATEGGAIEYLTSELRRRGLEPSLAMTAFDALVTEYRNQLPVLSAFGIGHERVSATERIRKTLLSRLGR